MQLMYKALDHAGTLVVTVPVDRHAWDAIPPRRCLLHLGVTPGPDRKKFFQRWYDESAIASRLLFDPLGLRSTCISNGLANASRDGYSRSMRTDWIRSGRERATVDDPREIADWYSFVSALGRHARTRCLRHRGEEGGMEGAERLITGEGSRSRPPDLSGNEEAYVGEAIRSSWISSTGSVR